MLHSTWRRPWKAKGSPTHFVTCDPMILGETKLCNPCFNYQGSFGNVCPEAKEVQAPLA